MRRHPSGNYIVEGRKKDLINRGGEKISAEEMENLILSHPAVQNVACVPMPDPALGEKMCACVVLRGGAALTFAELVDFLKARRSPNSSCRSGWRSVDELPVSTFGKVSKKALCGRSSGADRMRIIDLHCYPGTKEWIACQGPYVEALAKYWKRDGRRRQRTR